ncbi:hypothetical protein [Listeria innocua]|uniref:hypothetical protein n=1 Tax=Listeria innocua TaxID=1642 RepID=UPI0016295F36|nr:hypothetical protein [Listeria innocua]MBC1925133.1 hypothetical protein [Listeria innocua]
MKKRAVTFGRFNTFSKGHESFIQSILLKWDTVNIGVIDDGCCTKNYNKNKLFKNFIEECDENYINPLNKLQHRINLMEIALSEKGLLEKCSIKKINRPELYPDNFNELFPVHLYDVVFAIDVDSQFDIKKIGVFELLLNRPIKLVKAELILHTSDIIRTGKEQLGFSSAVIDYCKEHAISLGGKSIERKR